MKKLVTLICESMCLADLIASGKHLPGFDMSAFDMTGSRTSYEALWRMQSDDNLPEGSIHEGCAWQGEFISKRHKTRVFSHFWPKRFMPTFDQSYVAIPTKRLEPEPRAEQWIPFTSYLSAFRQDDVEWLIYWPNIGHSGDWCCRHPEESGIPAHLGHSCHDWLTLIEKEVLPQLAPDVPVLIHPDHGTARKGPGFGSKEFVEGFCLSRLLSQRNPMTWDWQRKLVRSVLS